MQQETSGIRINKYLSESGVCSRREADRQVEAGNVTINGVTAQMGDRVMPGDKVMYNGEKVSGKDKPVIIAFNKPLGVVCTAEKREENNIIDYINYPVRIYNIGRLDKDSEGLILLTNQGDLVNKMMRAGNFHEKEYICTVEKDISRDFLEQMRSGVYLEELDVTTRRCQVEKLTARTFKIILTQGYNRQIRRMCRACGYHVRALQRTRIMNIKLGDLPLGEYRDLTPEEIKELKRLTRDSYSAPKGTEQENKPTVKKTKKFDTAKKPYKTSAGKYTNNNGKSRSGQYGRKNDTTGRN